MKVCCYSCVGKCLRNEDNGLILTWTRFLAAATPLLVTNTRCGCSLLVFTMHSLSEPGMVGMWAQMVSCRLPLTTPQQGRLLMGEDGWKHIQCHRQNVLLLHGWLHSHGRLLPHKLLLPSGWLFCCRLSMSFSSLQAIFYSHSLKRLLPGVPAAAWCARRTPPVWMGTPQTPGVAT